MYIWPFFVFEFFSLCVSCLLRFHVPLLLTYIHTHTHTHTNQPPAAVKKIEDKLPTLTRLALKIRQNVTLNDEIIHSHIHNKTHTHTPNIPPPRSRRSKTPSLPSPGSR
jgi:hypothetical protein